MTWVVAYIAGRQEFKFQGELEAGGLTCYVPFITTTRWVGRARKMVAVKAPMFSGYAFVHFDGPIAWGPLRRASGFVTVLQADGLVLRMTDAEMDRMRREEEAMRAEVDKSGRGAEVRFAIGERVLVIGGPLDGKRGKVLRFSPGKKASALVDVSGNFKGIRVFVANLERI